MKFGIVEEGLDYVGEGSGDLVVAPSYMVGAPDCTVVVPDDMVERQICIGVTLDLLIARVVHTVTVVEGQTAPSFLPRPAR